MSWVGRVIRRFRDHGIAGLCDRREDNSETKLVAGGAAFSLDFGHVIGIF
jgi:hypothetical protein